HNAATASRVVYIYASNSGRLLPRTSTARHLPRCLPPCWSSMANQGTARCIEILLAIILPPLGVFLKFGCKVEFWICLLLTLFGYLPGIIYAVYAITK
ncbi:unnamed protein product, partial [Musa hybrid cultivar]